MNVKMIAEDGTVIETEAIIWMEDGHMIVNSKAERRTFSNIKVRDITFDSVLHLTGLSAIDSGTGEAPQLYKIIFSLPPATGLLTAIGGSRE